MAHMMFPISYDPLCEPYDMVMWFFRAKKQIFICYMYIFSPVSILGTYSIYTGYFIKMQNDLFFIMYSG